MSSKWKPGSLIRAKLKERVVAEAAKLGADEQAASDAFDHAIAESDRPILDWFLDGGFEKLLQIVMEILKFIG